VASGVAGNRALPHSHTQQGKTEHRACLGPPWASWWLTVVVEMLGVLVGAVGGSGWPEKWLETTRDPHRDTCMAVGHRGGG